MSKKAETRCSSCGKVVRPGEGRYVLANGVECISCRSMRDRIPRGRPPGDNGETRGPQLPARG